MESCRLDFLRSGQDPVDDFGVENVGQLFLQAESIEDEFLVVQAQKVQDRGVPILNAYLVFHGGETELVGGTVLRATLDPGPGKPRDHGVLVMVSTG